MTTLSTGANKHVDDRPLIAHLIFRFAVGGLENGLVNLLNFLPVDQYRHAIICLSHYSDFRERVQTPDVAIYALNKRAGHDLRVYWRLWRLLRKLKPALLHTRNLGALEYAVIGTLAGVPIRVHGEHGRDMTDIDGSNPKYRLFRRAVAPFITHFVTVSKDLEQWLSHTVGIREQRITQIYNGVDIEKFTSTTVSRAEIHPQLQDGDFIIGTVGRLDPEKNQALLIDAFAKLLTCAKWGARQPRLLIVGDGANAEALRARAKDGLPEGAVVFTGEREDVSRLLCCMDVFVLPSKGEGISNTILEAMASGLPVVATNVGGNAELVDDGQTGVVVPSGDSEAMISGIKGYVEDEARRRFHGDNARRRAQDHFSIQAMIANYQTLYDTLLGRGRVRRELSDTTVS